MTEEWRAVPGYQGLYEVSNLGRVKSLRRYVPHGDSRRLIRERILSPGHASTGYMNCRLYGQEKPRSVPVHHMVAGAFLGPRPAGMVVMHLNENALDNRAINLGYGTQSQNVQSSHDAGMRKNRPRIHGTCSESDCDLRARKRGWCPKHYAEYYRRSELDKGKLVLTKATSPTCAAGHLRAEHEYVAPKGGSYCRICQRERARNDRARKSKSRVE